MRYVTDDGDDAERLAYRNTVVARFERRGGSPAADLRKVTALRFDVEADIRADRHRARPGATMRGDLSAIDAVLSGRQTTRRENDPFERRRGEDEDDWFDRLEDAGCFKVQGYE